jgi:hypothetical protein
MCKLQKGHRSWGVGVRNSSTGTQLGGGGNRVDLGNGLEGEEKGKERVMGAEYDRSTLYTHV